MAYLEEMRPKHWIKNILILLPMFFGNALGDAHIWLSVGIGFLIFCLLSSAVYYLNDLHDIEKDRNHPTKRNRPIASGRISIPAARTITVVLVVASFGILIAAYLAGILHDPTAILIALFYFGVNVAYSLFSLKDVALLDVALLAAGFWLRLAMGSAVSGIVTSDWLNLVVIAGAFFLGFGKRRGEMMNVKPGETRKVLQSYSMEFLDKAMYVCLTLALAFFALWCKEKGASEHGLSYTILVPFLLLICFRYCIRLERGKSDGDPTNVILSDKVLLGLTAAMGLVLLLLLYF